MKTVAIVVVVLVVLLVIVLAVLAARRNKRRAALRERFGPEYDLAVKRGKDRRAVEQRLEQLAQQRDQLDIHDVPVQEHVRFAREWDAAQSRFVDDPAQSVADADGLVNSVLRTRGYPVESFDDRAALLATDHQDVVEGYRSAHDTFASHLQGSSTDTEALRQAFLHYREVFGRLNVPDGEVRGAGGQGTLGAAPTRREVEAAPAVGSQPEFGGQLQPEPEARHAAPAHSEPATTDRTLADRSAAEPPGRDSMATDRAADQHDGAATAGAGGQSGTAFDRPVEGSVDDDRPRERQVGAHRADPA